MFLVLVSYQKSISEVELHLQAHVSFLNKYYRLRKFIFSGRKIPRTGGVILINSDDAEEVKAILQEDPFYQHGIATYETTAFTPTMFDERFKPLVEQQA
jgi:uncharacterized protein YciI